MHPPIPSVPRSRDLAGDWIDDRYDDMINPPGLTNHLVTAQVDHDVTAIRSVCAPPLSGGDTITGQLYLEGRLLRSYGGCVETRWLPDRVERRTHADGWQVETLTLCPPDERAVVVRIRVRRAPDGTAPTDAAALRIGLWLDSTATCPQRPWLAPEPPSAPNSLQREPGLRVGEPEDRSAACLQALLHADGTPAAEAGGSGLDGSCLPDPRLLETSVEVAPEGGSELWFVHLLAPDAADARESLDRLSSALPDLPARTEARWDAELEAMFTPGNAEFGGCLPRLITEDDALRRLYWWGALGVLWFRRDNPASVLGRTYDTLMPRYWQTTTFIWDYSLSSLVHAMLDPGVMRRQITHWVGLDIEKHFGTEWLTGGPVGNWYSVNHFAMTRLVDDYVRWHGDDGLLAQELTSPDGRTASIAEHARAWARAWQRLRPDGAGLADYGGIDNLLECVSTYTHAVASLNAADVWIMRRVADLCAFEGDRRKAEALRSEAEELVPLVLDLAVEDEGFFRTRRPDGSEVAVRHVYDFATVGTTIPEDVPSALRERMVDFFVEELRTPTWMRALSAHDADAGFSLRADHQWNGAYPAWPPDAARASIALGRPEAALEWLSGLARSTNQGPPGQAHFVEDAVDPVAGGARKAPPQLPYILDWSCSSAGAWCELVLRGVFGLEAGTDGTLTADGCIADLDPDARLEGLVVQGREHTVDAQGVHPGRADR